MKTAAVMSMASVRERRKIVGMQTSKRATKVIQPISPTGTPFSVRLRLFILSERNTDHTHKTIAHVIMSKDEQIIMTATNSSKTFVFYLITGNLKFRTLLEELAIKP